MKEKLKQAYEFVLKKSQEKIKVLESEIIELKKVIEFLRNKTEKILKLPIIKKCLSKKIYPKNSKKLKNMINKYSKLGYSFEIRETEKSIHLKFS